MLWGPPTWVHMVPLVDSKVLSVLPERVTRTQRGNVGEAPVVEADVAPTLRRRICLIRVVCPCTGRQDSRCGELAFRFWRIITPALALALMVPVPVNPVSRAVMLPSPVSC